MTIPSFFRGALGPFASSNYTAANLQGSEARPTMDWANVEDGWEGVRQLYARHRVLLEMVWISGTYLRYLVPSWRKISSPKSAKYLRFPYVPLAVHVVVGTAEVLRYYCQLAMTGEWPKPNAVDLGLCLAMAATSLRLAANVKNGKVAVVRTTFQAMAAQRVVASTLGYVRDDARWHRASIKLLNNLVWTRLIGDHTRYLQGFQTYGDAFTGAVVVSHPLALWEGDYPAGIPLFVAIVLALLAVDKWASRKLDGK
ncbi:hypothetical protein LX36DRAFT_653286 [Colletotrichum falcatum]|nr:hypothetical protein LX36DRAFT_653286 [Colletotrichum falcatum]